MILACSFLRLLASSLRFWFLLSLFFMATSTHVVRAAPIFASGVLLSVSRSATASGIPVNLGMRAFALLMFENSASSVVFRSSMAWIRVVVVSMLEAGIFLCSSVLSDYHEYLLSPLFLL